MTAWQPGASPEILKERARLLRKVRRFFEIRDVLEVETPCISRRSAIDLHLEPLTVNSDSPRQTRYLITSPEYHMKRLLSAGSGSIYQIGKAFRREEAGRIHNPEFTIIEWYKVDCDHWRLMEDVQELLVELLNCPAAERRSYEAVFRDYLDLNPFDLTLDQFLNCCERNRIQPPGFLRDNRASADDRLNFLLAHLIEPKLAADRPVFIYDYPATQAGLARINPKHPQAASRFELYYRGTELGNGFHELADAGQQKNRLTRENRLREKANKSSLEPDERFLSALEHGLPDCSGVAIGFDRIVMFALEKESIDEVMSFSWGRA